MKKSLITVFASILCVLTLNAQMQTPKASPVAKSTQTAGLTEIEINYSRPAVKGRTIFGDFIPYGKMWRTGANLNSTISFTTDVTIAGKAIKQGTYAIFTVPGKDNWEIILYSEAENWGLPKVWEDSKIAVKTNAKANNTNPHTENLRISIENITFNTCFLEIAWAKTMVAIQIELPTKSMTLASIKSTLEGTPTGDDYAAAAGYYFDEDIDPKKALEWMRKAIEIKGGDSFWMLRRLALIEAKAGLKKDAIATLKSSSEAAKKAGNEDYVKMNDATLKEWEKK